MKRRLLREAWLVGLLPLLAFWPVTPLRGDEAGSLALLVETLENTANPQTQAALLRGMFSGLAGRRNVPAPEAWSRVATKLSQSKNAEVRELAAELSQVFGDLAATRKALSTLKNIEESPAVRRRALHALLTQRNTEVSKVLESLLDQEELRLDAIRGFATLENPAAPRLLLSRYHDWSPADRQAIIETLATRRAYAELLLRAIEGNTIPKSDIPAHVARSLQAILGESFIKIFGNVRALSKDRTALMIRYKKLVTDDALAAADAARGRVIFNKTCASCHLLYGVGGKIGPDLTGSNRGNLDYLLLNSVDPSYDVPEGYKMVIIKTTDGRVLNGVIAEEDAQRVVLKTVQDPHVIVLKSDIETRRVSPKSIMPDGQLEQMKPKEILNLIKYLQTVEQVEVPE